MKRTAVACAIVLAGAVTAYTLESGVRLVALATALTAAAMCLRRARPATGRSPWSSTAGAAAAWAVGDLIGLAEESDVIPSAAAAVATDLLGVLALLLVASAVVRFVGPGLRGLALFRSVIDGLATGGSIFLLAWTRTLATSAPESLRDWNGLLRLAVPLLDSAVLAVVLLAWTRLRPDQRRSWWGITVGCAFVTMGDSAIAYLHLADTLHLADLGFLCRGGGLLLIALAGVGTTRDDDVLSIPPTPRPFNILLPYAPLVIAGAEILSRQLHDELDRTSVLLCAFLAVLLGARQLLTQFENLASTRHLEQRVAERTEALDRQERRFRALAQHATDVLIVVDVEGMVSYQSAAAERVLGFGGDALLDQPFVTFVHPDDVRDFIEATAYAPAPPAPPSVVELRLARGGSSEFVITEISITNLLGDDGVQGMLLTVRDVSERRTLEERLRHDALHDPLTGLGNRTLFSDRLENALARSARGDGRIGVLLVDLDGFKVVNDSLGHAAGDELLVAVAGRLRSVVRPGDTVARMGGDEFAVLIECDDDEVPQAVARRMLAGLKAPVPLAGKAIVPSASVGVAIGRGGRRDGADLLRNADLALYEAKNRGRCRYQLFEDGMEKQAALRVELESDLRRAIRNDELLLHYQPLLALPTGDLIGVEALLRWCHPTRGLIPPNDFIPIAEESDLVGELGCWVLHRSCSDLMAWREQNPDGPDLSVAVNIATRQLLTPWLVDQVREALTTSGLPPRCLTLEITEGALMADTAASISTLEALQALGVRLAIDDFGTGWSSLARLRTFPADKLKIDRAFVSEIEGPDDPAPLVSAVTAMAHSLGLRVVAEGVETPEQLACLAALGVDEVQGYLLSRPIPATEIADLLTHDDRLVRCGGAGEDEPTTVEAVVADLQQATGVDAAFVLTVDWTAERHRVLHAAGLVELAAGDDLPLAGSPCVRALAGEPLVDDLERVVRGHPLGRVGLTWLLTVPVLDPHDEVWAALSVGGRVGTAPPDPALEAVLWGAAHLLAAVVPAAPPASPATKADDRHRRLLSSPAPG